MILDVVQALVIVLDCGGRIVYCNRECERVSGYCLDELLGRVFYDLLLVPEEREQVMGVFQNLLAGESSSQYENALVSKDGQNRWIAWTNAALMDKDGEVVYMAGTGIEISEQMNVQDALRASEQQGQALLDALPDLMFRIRSDGIFLDYHANDADELFQPPERFLDRNVQDVLPTHLAALTMEAIQRTLETGEMQVYEYQVKDGSGGYYESRLVKSGADEVLSIVRDITDRKQAETALLRREAILEAVNSAAECFLMEPSWEDGISDVLDRLGRAANVGIVGLFENTNGQNGLQIARITHFWHLEETSGKESPLPEAAFDLQREDLQDFSMQMRQGKPVIRYQDQFPEDIRLLLAGLDVHSILAVPIHMGHDWWGFIGLGDDGLHREWSVVEVEALKTATRILGSAIRRSQAQKVRIATLRISEAAHSAQDLDALYRGIHEIITTLMPAQNFYIALYDQQMDLISFPYEADEYDEKFPPHKPGRGLTEYVLRTGEPLLATPEVFDELVRSGQVDSVGVPSIDWLGVPLKTQERTIGVLAIQSYTESIRFSNDDMQMLIFISTQIAMAIERRLVEEDLRASEERFRSLLENIPLGVYRVSLDAEGKFLMVNPAFLAIFGFEKEEELQNLSVGDLFPNRDNWKLFASAVRSQGSASSIDLQMKRKDGTVIWVSLTGRVTHTSTGQAQYLDCTIEDITVRSQRAKEREALISFAAIIRSKQTRSEIVGAILDYVAILMGAESLAFVLGNLAGDRLAIEEARGYWEYLQQHRMVLNDGLCREIIAGRIPYLENGILYDPLFTPSSRLGSPRAVICLPLMTENKGIGAVWLAREKDFSEEETQLLAAIGDIGASALQRAMLHEQTALRVQRLSALRAIDMAISASMDLRMVLGVLLEQLRVQLEVPAACVLRLKPQLQILECVAFGGFRMNTIQHNRLRLSDRTIGKAILEQKNLRLDDLSAGWESFIQSRGLEGEGFLTYYFIPLIAKGQLVGALETFHRERFLPDTEWLDFLEMLAGQAAIAIDSGTLFDDLQRSNMELHLAYDNTLEGWVRAMDLRLGEEEQHTQQITEITLRLGRMMSIREQELEHIRRGALLHDIGKMAIPDAILLKPGPLTDAEWQIVRRHPVYARELLGPITYLRPALAIPISHHERWDGDGYPNGLKGLEIPLAARIFAVVDTWFSMISKRPYREAHTKAEARNYIASQAGAHFDPEIVGKFLDLVISGTGSLG